MAKQKKYFKIYYLPGQENLSDYPSKHYMADTHQHIRPYYVHTDKSPQSSHRPLSLVFGEGVLKSLGTHTARSPHYNVLGPSLIYLSPQVSLATE